MRNCLIRARAAAHGLVFLGAALLGGLSLAGPAESGALHVSPSGTDSSSCGGQGSPCQHIDYAVNKALNGDTVRVAGGTYFFRSVAPLCNGIPIQSIVCLIDKAITIIGGYSPSTWAFDPGANPTVIDGQNTYRGAFIFSSSSPSVRLTMAHITIQNARAMGIAGADPTAFGGAINSDNAAVTLQNVTFLNNRAVGADTVSGEGGTGVGSALSIRSARGGAVSYLNNVRFQGNSSVGGRGPTRGGFAFGAVFVFGSPIHIENASFISNSAIAAATSPGSPNADLPSGLGGAISLMGGSVASLMRVTATGNQVVGGDGPQYGGGGFGGAVYAEDSTVTIQDSVFQSNVARAGAGPVNGGFAAGGGVMYYNAKGSIDRTRIVANRTTGGNSSSGSVAGNAGGGGLYLWRGDSSVTLPVIEVTNTVIADNILEPGQGLTPSGGGGGLQVQGLVAHLSHVTLARNQLGPGLTAGQAALVVQGGPPGAIAAGTLNLDYSVVANHVASTTGATALVVIEGNTLNLNRVAFSGNTKDVNTTGIPAGTITGLTTTTTVASAGFVSAGPPNYDYHITSGSALRGAATGSTVAVDVDYQPRVDGLRDLGAHEYVGNACTAGSGADSDADGIPDAVEQGEGTRPCAKDNDVFASTRLFLMQLNRDFLGHEFDIDSILAWLASMGTGTPANVAVKAFSESPEFVGAVSPIVRLYFAYFDRIPDLGGLESWTAQLRAGMSLAAISEAFANSAEFQDVYGSLTNAQFVTLVYRNVLGRDPDPDGNSYWLGQLDSGAMTRGKVMMKFSKSVEFKQGSRNAVLVTTLYYAMLHRMPKQGGLDYWTEQLGSGTPLLVLVDALLGAAGYRARFLP